MTSANRSDGTGNPSPHAGSDALSSRRMSEQQKLVFTVPAEMHEAIKDAAAEEERSMASWIRRAIAAALPPATT